MAIPYFLRLPLSRLGIHNTTDLALFGVVPAFLSLKAMQPSFSMKVLYTLAIIEKKALLKTGENDTIGVKIDLTRDEKQKLRTATLTHRPVKIMPSREEAESFMAIALQEATLANYKGEVPVGAVLVYQGKVIARAANNPISSYDPTAHAEIAVLRLAAQIFKNYRLEHCDVYVTLEPCPMCASALLQARVARVIYAAKEPKTGAAGSVIDLFSYQNYNQHTAVMHGILEEESIALLRDFFQSRRKR